MFSLVKIYILANTLRRNNRLLGHLLMGMNSFEKICIAFAFKADWEIRILDILFSILILLHIESLLLQHFKRFAFKTPEFPN